MPKNLSVKSSKKQINDISKKNGFKLKIYHYILNILSLINQIYRSVRDSIARGKEIIAQDLREKGSSSFSGLMCWSCSAENMDQCIEKGEVEICDNTEVIYFSSLLLL